MSGNVDRDADFEELRLLVQDWRDGAQQRLDRWEREREWRKADRTEGEIVAFDEVLAAMDCRPEVR